MGAFVSLPTCRADYHVNVTCDFNLTISPPSIGGFTKGGFQSNSDIAGIGYALFPIAALDSC